MPTPLRARTVFETGPVPDRFTFRGGEPSNRTTAGRPAPRVFKARCAPCAGLSSERVTRFERALYGLEGRPTTSVFYPQTLRAGAGNRIRPATIPTWCTALVLRQQKNHRRVCGARGCLRQMQVLA